MYLRVVTRESDGELKTIFDQQLTPKENLPKALRETIIQACFQGRTVTITKSPNQED